MFIWGGGCCKPPIVMFCETDSHIKCSESLVYLIGFTSPVPVLSLIPSGFLLVQQSWEFEILMIYCRVVKVDNKDEEKVSIQSNSKIWALLFVKATYAISLLGFSIFIYKGFYDHYKVNFFVCSICSLKAKHFVCISFIRLSRHPLNNSSKDGLNLGWEFFWYMYVCACTMLCFIFLSFYLPCFPQVLSLFYTLSFLL